MNKPQIKAPLVKGAAAFSKSIAVLQMVADAPKPPTMTELVRQSGLPRPTLHRLLKALEAEKMIVIRQDKTFIVGARVIQLAGRALIQNDVSRYAEQELEWLCNETQETAHLAIRSGDDLVYIKKKDSPHAVRIASSIGGRLPMHASAIGKCILAHLDSEEQTQLLESMEMERLTQHTIVEREVLEAEILKIRTDGFAVSHQESDTEIECYGVCIFDRDGAPVAGIGISVPLFRKNENRDTYIRPLLECRNRIAEKLGQQNTASSR
jgi:IclR family KDG regulon transcriptional repressor